MTSLKHIISESSLPPQTAPTSRGRLLTAVYRLFTSSEPTEPFPLTTPLTVADQFSFGRLGPGWASCDRRDVAEVEGLARLAAGVSVYEEDRGADVSPVGTVRDTWLETNGAASEQELTEKQISRTPRVLQ